MYKTIVMALGVTAFAVTAAPNLDVVSAAQAASKGKTVSAPKPRAPKVVVRDHRAPKAKTVSAPKPRAPKKVTVRDHRAPKAKTVSAPKPRAPKKVVVRDHRTPKVTVRDHRKRGSDIIILGPQPRKPHARATR